MKIALTSDTHYGRTSSTRGLLEEMLTNMAAEEPDIILHAGDWSSTKHQELWECLELFRKYFPNTNIISALSSNHDCLDTETECCTSEGWLKYSEIQPHHMVLGLDPSGNAVWQPIQEIIIRENLGKMKSIFKVGMELLCTPNHRLIYQKRVDGGSKGAYWGSTQIRSIEEMSTNRIRIPVSGVERTEEYEGLSDRQLRLAGLMLTDACLSKHITFTQRESNAHKVRQILEENGVVSHESIRDTSGITEICGRKLKKQPENCVDFRLTVAESARVYGLTETSSRVRLPNWTERLSSRQFLILLDTLVEFDGTRYSKCPSRTANVRDETAVLYKPKAFLDELQIQCALHGYHTSIYPYRTRHRLNICKRQYLEMDFSRKKLEELEYRGDVWCLRVLHENFLIRRNGKVHFTGNCWRGDDEDSKFFRELRTIQQLLESIKRAHIAFDVQDELVTDTLAIKACQSWYRTTRPPSNDHYWMPGGSQDHVYMTTLAHQSYDETKAFITEHQGKTKIVVSHFTPYNYRYGYTAMCGPVAPFDDMIKLGLDYLCLGHSHEYQHQHIDQCLVLNAGGDYDKPRYVIFEV